METNVIGGCMTAKTLRIFFWGGGDCMTTKTLCELLCATSRHVIPYNNINSVHHILIIVRLKIS